MGLLKNLGYDDGMLLEIFANTGPDFDTSGGERPIQSTYSPLSELRQIKGHRKIRAPAIQPLGATTTTRPPPPAWRSASPPHGTVGQAHVGLSPKAQQNKENHKLS